MEKLLALRKDFEDKVQQHFPESLVPLKAALAVVAINSFQHNQQPVTLIFSGPSGSGKTQVLSLIIPRDAHNDLVKYVLRCDGFTARSFVTHSANIPKEKLEEIDLLPKIENKTLITKELAPVFRGDKDELIKTFAMLISILDGKGYISASGSQGLRGYDKPINFTWLGATTPLTNETFRLMAQLGTRLMFFDTGRGKKTIAQLVEFAERTDHFQKEEECAQSVQDYLQEYFKIHPPKSFDESSISFDTKLMRQMCVYAKLMAHLRAALASRKEHESDDNDGECIPWKENEERAIIILKNIALGSALMEQRDHVNESDIMHIKHIALSSCPEGRRLVSKALLDCGGIATTRELMKMTGFSCPTCINYMKELSHLGVCKYSDCGCDNAHSIEISGEFAELVVPPRGTDEPQKAA
jgi:hypothetical protein